MLSDREFGCSLVALLSNLAVLPVGILLFSGTKGEVGALLSTLYKRE